MPFEVVNDGEVTALAGSMSLGENAILGIAFGTSTAAGYVTPDGNITSWLNELAFVPVDYSPDAPVDEWSGDYGVGSQYFSQQCVGRLMPAAGIEAPADHAVAGAAEARPGADARGRSAREEDLPDHRHVPWVWRRALRGVLRASARAGAGPRHLRSRRRRHRRQAHAKCWRSSFRNSPAVLRFTCPTSTTSATARPLPPPACLPSRGGHEPVSPVRLRARAARQRRPEIPAGRLSGSQPSTPIAPDAPRALIFSPHPDDECIIGGLALRLMREAGMRVVNVAVTQGSNKARQAARLEELRAACDYLGFDLVADSRRADSRTSTSKPGQAIRRRGGRRST